MCIAQGNDWMARIGVFYDGGYFSKISNHYLYEHQKKKQLSILGLHDYIERFVAEKFELNRRFTKISSSHFFRGRLGADDARTEQKLFVERVLDEELMVANIQTHYMPLKRMMISKTGSIKYKEKGVDVWLALEVFEQASRNAFDVCVLVVCDGDYIPLVHKLNTLGKPVIVLYWEFDYEDRGAAKVEVRANGWLMREATFAVPMHEAVETEEGILEFLFKEQHAIKDENIEPKDVKTGPIITINKDKGYGHIGRETDNLFFHWSSVQDGEFNTLVEGDIVSYIVGGHDGKAVAKNVRVKVTD